MKDPPHPGKLLKLEVVDTLGFGVTDAAKKLGISRVALSRVLNGHAGISPDLALRLEQAGLSTARAWMAMQSNYELAKIRLSGLPKVGSLLAA